MVLRADRITDTEWKKAFKNRYLDLRDGLNNDVSNADMVIEIDNKQMAEWRLLGSIAKLHGIDVKLPE